MEQILLVIGIVLVLIPVGYIVSMILKNMKYTFASDSILSLEKEHFKSLIEKNQAQSKKINDEKEYGWQGFRKFKVSKLVNEGGNVTSVYLEPHNKKKLPPFSPGQYLTFNWKVPGEKKDAIRCYSLSDAPSDDYFRISVKKVPPPRDNPDAPAGLVSNFIGDQLKEDEIIDVKAPSGAFFLEPHDNTPIVLLGGGIGVTPVLSMLKTLKNIESKREVHFFYGVRSSSDHALKEEIESIRRTYPSFNIHICYSSPLETDKKDADFQFSERVSVDLLTRVLPQDLALYEYYLCGPPPFMNSLVEGLQEIGVEKSHINFEAFGPATVKKVKPKAEASSESFDIKIGDDVLKWDGSFETILECAEENGVSLNSGCRVGNCGTCLVAVKNGDIEYNEKPNFEVETGSCLTCISVPKSNIELDI